MELGKIIQHFFLLASLRPIAHLNNPTTQKNAKKNQEVKLFSILPVVNPIEMRRIATQIVPEIKFDISM